MGYSIDQDLEIMKEIERISQEPVNESQYTAVRHGGKPIVESMAVFDDVKVDFNKWTSDNKKVNKAKGVDFSKRLSALVDKYNDRRDSAIFADEVLTEVANQMVDLLKELNKEKKSFFDLGISYEEKAFYDILKSIAKQFCFEYPEDKLLKLAAEIKQIVADKSKYTDWSIHVSSI